MFIILESYRKESCFRCLCSALPFNFAPTTLKSFVSLEIGQLFLLLPSFPKPKSPRTEGESDMVSVCSLTSLLIFPLLVLLSTVLYTLPLCGMRSSLSFFHRLHKILAFFFLFVCVSLRTYNVFEWKI